MSTNAAFPPYEYTDDNGQPVGIDIDIANAIHAKLLQEGAKKLLVDNISAFDEVWTVSHGAGENLRSLGYEGAYTVMENGVDAVSGENG